MADSVHEAILDAVETRLEALDLDGTEERIERRFALDETWLINLKTPCLIVSPVGSESESTLGDVTGKDGWQYPLVVRIVERVDRENKKTVPHILKWRQRIKRALHHQQATAPFTSIVELMDILYQSSTLLEPAGLEYKLLISSLNFLCFTREIRDYTA